MQTKKKTLITVRYTCSETGEAVWERNVWAISAAQAWEKVKRDHKKFGCTGVVTWHEIEGGVGSQYKNLEG